MSDCDGCRLLRAELAVEQAKGDADGKTQALIVACMIVVAGTIGFVLGGWVTYG